MNNDYQKFFELIKDSKSILLLTHMYSDIDAISSCLLMKNLLVKRLNKAADIYAQSPSYRGVGRMFKYYPQYFNENNINYVKSAAEIDFAKYDTIIVLDCYGLGRVFTEKVEVDLDKTKYIVIDHHDDTPEKCHLTINELCCSTTEQIFHIFNSESSIDFDKEQSELAQIGMIADSSNFLYTSGVSNKTFESFSELRDITQMDSEIILKSYYGTTIKGQEVFASILKNATFIDNCVYSWIDEEFLDNKEYSQDDIVYSMYQYTDRHMYFIEGIDWGFVVQKVKELDDGQFEFKVSFRSLQFYTPVRDLALQFNGGGHLYGGGCTIKGDSYKDVIGQILNAAKELKFIKSLKII